MLIKTGDAEIMQVIESDKINETEKSGSFLSSLIEEKDEKKEDKE